tara:strand:- start:39 stop:218 length:180 start_codon:yes stop_codon:yes gene_type:complete
MIDYLIAGEPKKIESVRIETPLGAIESDSGNHAADVATVLGIVIVLYIFKRLYFGRKNG